MTALYALDWPRAQSSQLQTLGCGPTFAAVRKFEFQMHLCPITHTLELLLGNVNYKLRFNIVQ